MALNGICKYTFVILLSFICICKVELFIDTTLKHNELVLFNNIIVLLIENIYIEFYTGVYNFYSDVIAPNFSILSVASFLFF